MFEEEIKKCYQEVVETREAYQNSMVDVTAWKSTTEGEIDHITKTFVKDIKELEERAVQDDQKWMHEIKDYRQELEGVRAT